MGAPGATRIHPGRLRPSSSHECKAFKNKIKTDRKLENKEDPIFQNYTVYIKERIFTKEEISFELFKEDSEYIMNKLTNNDIKMSTLIEDLKNRKKIEKPDAVNP